MKTTVLFFAIFLLSFTSLNAQTELTSYGWEQHGIYSLVPVGAEITINTSDTFEVEDDYYTVRIELFDINGMGEDDLAYHLLEGAEIAGISDPSDISSFVANGNDIAYVTGRDSYNNAVLFGLIFGGTEDTYVAYTVVCAGDNWDTAVKMISSVKMK